ncbi:extracellular solute-binding protein [Paenibacillus sp. HB172176]|uniref:ABC transporter substrate-binding protein n=1 Tax=Paenibacillus sp. HB172176 TaxID=2493690 RepID=UPI00143A9F31|nr:extracellular solute-binding protein [Paenibacillus sp. HB172176]
MKKINWTVMLLACVMLLGLLSACSNSSGNGNANNQNENGNKATNAQEGTKKEDVTITLATAAGDSWLRPIDKEIIADFTKETGIKVDIQTYPADQYAGVLKTKLAAADAPDVSLVWPEANSAQFLPDENFLDLSGEAWVQDMTEAAKRNGTYNGKLIGWNPSGGDSGWGVMYNKEIFEKLGLSAPTTFEQFMEVSAQIKASGVTPIFEPLKDTWHSGIWLALSGPLADKNQSGFFEGLNNNTAKFADSPVLETFLEQYKQMYDKGYFGDNALSNTFTQGLDSLESGKYAMFMIPATFDVQSEASGSTFDFSKYGAFPSPFGDNRMLAVYDGTIIRTIYKNSKHIDAAKQYLAYISRPEVLEKYYASVNLNPAFQAFEPVQADIEKSLISNSDGTNNTVMEAGIKFWDGNSIGNYIIELLLGQKSAKQVLEAIDKDRIKLFEAQEN